MKHRRHPAAEESESSAVRGFDADLERFGLHEAEEWFAQVRTAESVEPLLRLASYELLCEVQRGGQGIVYRGRRAGKPPVVAVKRLFLSPLRPSGSRERFERAVEALSTLNHPFIVPLEDVEFVQNHEALLVMPWIDGLTIDRWARPKGKEDRSPQAIISLFLHVCEAVEHAHQRGVIHRDLKPSNILVDSEGKPHVLDFGIARFLEDDEAGPPASARAITLTAQFLGTLAYASPEQLAGPPTPIDARSDVYALGVILFQLLTGRLPHAPAASAEQMRERIRQEIPARPSSMRRDLLPDLDAVILTAVAADASQRYSSVDALQSDLRRYLAGKPVVAQPPSRWRTLRATMHRHRLATAVVLTTMVLVSLAAVGASILAFHLASARAQEQHARSLAEDTAQIFQEIFVAADPYSTSEPDLTVREVLDIATAHLAERDDLAPSVRASLLAMIGKSYRGLGRLAEAERSLEESLRLRRGISTSPHEDVVVSRANLAVLRYEQGRFAEAEQLFRDALSMQRQLRDPDPIVEADIQNDLGASLRAQEKLEEAAASYHRALDTRQRVLGGNDLKVAETLNNIAGLHLARGELEEAIEKLRRVLEIRRQHLAPDHPLVAQALDNLGVLLAGQKKFDEAIELMKQAIEAYRSRLDPHHPMLAHGIANLGNTLERANRSAEGEPYLRDALQLRQESLSPDHISIAKSHHSLGICLGKQQKFDEAQFHLQKALEMFRVHYGDEHVQTQMAARNVELFRGP